MKIIRTKTINEKIDNNKYHQLSIDYHDWDNTLNIHKEIWISPYINSMSSTKCKIDRIKDTNICSVYFMTENIEKLTPKLEKRMIKKIIKEIKKHYESIEFGVQRSIGIVDKWKNLNNELLNSNFFREDKLKRILKKCA